MMKSTSTLNTPKKKLAADPNMLNQFLTNIKVSLNHKVMNLTNE
jgi:hypothetical protein